MPRWRRVSAGGCIRPPGIFWGRTGTRRSASTIPIWLAPYVYRTGRNIALNRLRADTAQKRDSGYDVSLDELAECVPGCSTEDALDAKLLGQAIDRFLDTQNSRTRRLFLRRYWFGDSVKDIAAAMGMQPNAVSVRLNRTRQELRTYLMKEGIIDEA